MGHSPEGPVPSPYRALPLDLLPTHPHEVGEDSTIPTTVPSAPLRGLGCKEE